MPLEDRVDTLSAPPDFAALQQRLRAHPLLQQLEARQKTALAMERLERARRWPDLALTVGIQRLEGTPTRAFTGGIALPIPLFNRNQGAIQAARAAYQATLEQWSSAHITLGELIPFIPTSN